MWSRHTTPTPEKPKNRAPAPPPHIHGKYDWRLRCRRQDRLGDTDASLPVAVGASLSSSGAALESLPAGLFASAGSRGSTSAQSNSHGNETCDDAAARLLLHPGRALASTPGSSVSSQTAAFLHTPFDGTSRLSRTTSVDSAFDEGQERCIHTAYRVSFHGDRRIKERPLRVTIDGVCFVLVERVVSGHSDGVYQKSKKIWENVPRGQARVFASAASTPQPSLPSSPVGSGGAEEAAGSNEVGGQDHSELVGSPSTGSPSHGRPRSVSPTGSSRGGGSFTATLVLVASVDGLRKFAHWGDASSSIYNVNKEVPVSAVAVEKIDGEGCHVAAFTFEGERYWVIGLRDRHLLVRLWVPQEDVDAYNESEVSSPPLLPHTTGENSTHTPSSTPVAAPTSASARAFTRASMKVAVAWRAILSERLAREDVVEMHQTMCEKRWTLCFDAVVMGCEHLVDHYPSASSASARHGEDKEARDHTPAERERSRHVTGDATESDGGSPLSEAAEAAGASDTVAVEDFLPLFFYAITFHETSDKGLSLPVEEAMAFFRRYRLPTAAFSAALEVNSPDYDAHRAMVSSAINSAGCVFYGTNAQGLVVRLWRCRCYPYELERAAQEFIVTHRLHGSIFRAKFQKKLSGLSREARASAAAWEKQRLPFLFAFADWLHSTNQLTPSTDLASLQELRGHWITAQHAFRHDLLKRGEDGPDASRRGTAADADRTGVGEDDCLPEEEEEEEEDVLLPETILLMGPQGCGKSTLARALFSLLEQTGCTPRWINQDEVGNRKAYLAAIRRAASSGAYTHIILDKMNLDDTARNDYAALNLKTVLTVAWTHAQGTDALVDVCFERVKRRGASHRTFKATLDLEKCEPTAALLPCSSGGASPPQSLSPLQQPTQQQPQPPFFSLSGTSTANLACAGNADVRLRRMRGILQDCATRYEVPEVGAGLLELDVTLNCNATLGRVWNRLREQSIYDLPCLSQLDAQEAFSVAFGYEKLMLNYPHRIMAVVLQANEPAELKEMVPGDVLEGGGKKALEQIHVVLHNFTEQPSPSALVRYAALDGTLAMAEIKAVMADPKATLLHVGRLSREGGGGGGAHRSASPLSAKRGKANGVGGAAAAREKDRRHDQAVPLSSPSSSDASSSSSSLSGSQSREAAWLHMAVLAKAKKTPYRYCAQLLERVVLASEPDPYVTVHHFPRGTCAPFTYHFVTQ